MIHEFILIKGHGAWIVPEHVSQEFRLKNVEPAIGQRPDTFERHAERAGDTDLLTMGHRSTMSENYLMLTRDDTRAVFRQSPPAMPLNSQ